jgi:oligosaccharide repeat unit polymerase
MAPDSLSYIVWGINLILIIVLCASLKLHQTGIFTFGFFNVVGGLVPLFIAFPLYAMLSENPVAFRENFITVLVMVMLMLLGLLTGVLCDRRRTVPLYERARELNLPSIYIFMLLAVALGALLGLLLIFRGSFNPFELLQGARSADSRIVQGEHELSYPLLFLQASIISLQMLLVFNLYRNARSFSSFLKGLTVTLLSGFVLMSLGSRTSFFMPIVLFIFATHHLYRRIPASVIVGLFVAAMPVFVFLRIVSGGHSAEELSASGTLTDVSVILEEFIARFSGFINFVDLVDWFDNKSCVLGLTFVQFLVRPIPRYLMPDKPSSIDVFFSYELYGKPQFGGSVALFGGLGEMYYNFYFPGIFLWFILVGILLSRLHFGTIKLIEERRFTAAALVIGNYGLLRGISNLGVNTSGSQQLVMNLVAQAAIYFLLVVSMYLIRGNRRERPDLYVGSQESLADRQ